MRSDESEQEIGKYKNEVNEIKQQLIRLTNDYQTDKKSVKVAASVLAMCLVGFFGFTYYQIGEKIDKALDVIIIQNAKTKAIEAQELAQNASDNSVRFLQQIKDIHTSITRYASEIEKYMIFTSLSWKKLMN